MKSYWEQKYPYILVVALKWHDSPIIWMDRHKGLNAGHALYLAKENWCDAEVTPVGKYEPKKRK